LVSGRNAPDDPRPTLAATVDDSSSPAPVPRARDHAPAGGGGQGGEVGDTVAHFRIRARIGQGGMGIVYRAIDDKLGREVALKVLPAEVVGRGDRRERFLREARAAAAVAHPAIATVYEAGADGDVPYLAMEYVAGRTLREVLAGGPLPAAELIRIALPIADALARAHRAGVVHRDLKPENIMLDGDGAPKILDFGLARLFDPAAPADGLTQDGAILGTPAYMSPEQARGRAVDHRSDLFSLGTVLFELVTGRAPFHGSSTIDVATAILRDAPAAPSSGIAGVPAELDRIVLKCLEKDPDDRFQSASELVVDLRRLQRQIGRAAAPPRTRRGGRWWIAAAVVIAAGAVVWLALPRRSPPGPGTPPIERQLTSSTSRAFQAAQLSPDGAQLLLVQDGRIMLQPVAGGVPRELAAPPMQPNWARWFPDGRRLLLGVPSGPTQLDLIALPVDGGPATTLPIHPWGASLSPDGTRIASFDRAGIRVARLDGSEPRLLAGTREEAEFVCPVWSPDGRWLAYAIRGPDLRPQLRAVAADGSSDVLVVEDPKLSPLAGLPAYAWLGDGRIVYNTYADDGSALVAIDVDPATARPRGPPVVRASYPDITVIENPSRDGSALLYVRMHLRLTRYRARLGGGPLSVEPTPYQSWDLVGATPDGKTEVYLSKPGAGRAELLAIGPDPRPRVLAAFPGLVFDPRITPSGDAVLYLHVDDDAHAISLRRVALTGGTPAIVERLPYPPSAPATYTQQLVVQLGCGRAPGTPCVLGATEGRQQIFYEVDPEHGRGRKLAALDGPPPWTWDLRADGKRLVIAQQDQAVRILEIGSGPPTIVLGDPGMMVGEAAWIGGADAFLLAGNRASGKVIARVDLRGPGGSAAPPAEVWTSAVEGVRLLRVSSDGGSVTFRASSWSRDYWLRRDP
jgi:serine/threonine protein kinase